MFFRILLFIILIFTIRKFIIHKLSKKLLKEIKKDLKLND